MALFAFLFAPTIVALVLLGAATWVRRHPALASRALAGGSLVAAAAALASAVGGSVHTALFSWVPALGVDFSLRAGPLRLLLLALLYGIAAAVLLFAGSAYRRDRRLPSLLAGLLLFSTSMIGIVLSDDVLLLFVFWEATSILSFLLIGWYHDKAGPRGSASQALLVTGLGGLALLAGLILLRTAAGTGSLAEITAIDLSGHTFTPAIIVLVGIAALTKSAQFPFHFWLPNAMAGPTPVSAFLHSATMVKAGVLLLAFLAPALANHALWTPLFVTSGFLTVGLAVWRGWRQTDLKALLAATTLAALGHLTILAGLGTPAALQAFLIFLLAHALYKAPLFLAAGALEDAYRTRDITCLRGALVVLPVPGAAIAISLLSLLGVPILPGFIGKEYLLKSAWAIHPTLALAAALSFAGVIALAVRSFAPLMSRGKVHLPKGRPAGDLQIAPCLPAAFALLLMFTFPWLAPSLFASATAALGAPDLAPLKLWPGWSPVLALSLGALALGTWFGLSRPARQMDAGLPPLFESLYQALFDALGRTGAMVARTLQDHPLRTHLVIVLAASGSLIAAQLLATGLAIPALNFAPGTAIPSTLAILIAGAGASAALARRRLELLAVLGLLGLLIALLYSYFSAPDLALTQLLTETILLVFLVAVLFRLPARTDAERARRSPLAFPVALLGGLVTTGLVLTAKALELTPPVSSFFTERSLDEANGANVVNVILVDFRALDTLGEITVLGVAALGATALLRIRPLQLEFQPTRSNLLHTALPLLLVPLFIFSLLFFLRGHNHPGGGFIAALVAATGFAFVAISGSPSRFVRHDLNLVLAGVVIATAAGLLALAAAKPFFTGLWLTSKLGTPLLFDAGVFLAVLGFALAFLRRFLPQPFRP